MTEYRRSVARVAVVTRRQDALSKAAVASVGACGDLGDSGFSLCLVTLKFVLCPLKS